MLFRIIIFYTTVGFLLYGNSLFSQDSPVVSKSDKTEKINGRLFYVHEIQKGETLYSISKAYNVDKNTIAAENPEIFEKFVPGQILKIPFTKSGLELPVKNSPVHIVEKGETLYSISRKYNIAVNDIVSVNKIEGNNIQPGQKLIIKKTAEAGNTPPPDTSKFIYHKVEKGQTVYSISKMYSIPIELLFELNTELENSGLKAGMLLKIPGEKSVQNDFIMVKPVEKDSSADQQHSGVSDSLLYKSSNCGTYEYDKVKETFNIALFLPFQGDAITLEAEEEASVNSNFEPAPKPFLEYYEGFLLAVDSARQMGINLTLNVSDLRRDSASTSNMLKSGELNGTDLIIGPVYESNFKIISDFALINDINIIYPINSNNSGIFNNPKIFQLNSGLYCQISQAARFFTVYKDINCIIIHSSNAEENELAGIYKKIFEQCLGTIHPAGTGFHDINYSVSGISGIENAMSADKINFIIIPSGNQIFVINLLTKLQPLTKRFRIILSGNPSWKKFDNNLDLEYLHNLNLHSFTPFYIDYESPAVKSFILRYRENFKCEPSKYSFLGFDTGIYFLTALKKYGKNFQGCLKNHDVNLLQSCFNFYRVSDKGGYENNGTFILHYSHNNDVKVLNIIKETVTLPAEEPDIQLRKLKP